MALLFQEPQTKGAILSDCRKYRYELSRCIGAAPTVVAYFGVNPSTADASIDDATVRKWTGFSSRNVFGRFIVGNVFAYRATNVTELASCADPIGPENPMRLAAIIEQADVLVPCWGDRGKVPKSLRSHFDRLMQQLKASEKPVKVFGYTKGGDPMHPLMLGYETSLKEAK